MSDPEDAFAATLPDAPRAKADGNPALIAAVTLAAVALVGVVVGTAAVLRIGEDEPLQGRAVAGEPADAGRPRTGPAAEPSEPDLPLVDDPPPVAFALGEALWGSDDGGPFEVVSGAALHGDTAILWGGASLLPERLSVVDAATGQERWGRSVFDDLTGGDHVLIHPFELVLGVESANAPAVTDAGAGGTAVVVPYLSGLAGSAQEYGVAALALDDGHVLWRAPIVPAGQAAPMDGPTITQVGVIAGAGTVLAVADPGDVDQFADPAGWLASLHIVALAPSSGEVLWDTTGVWPVGVAGDTVVVQTASGQLPGLPAPASVETSVLGLDAATGATRWTRPGAVPALAVRPIAGDAVLLTGQPGDGSGGGPDGAETVVVAASTGDDLASFQSTYVCGSDGATLMACVANVAGHPYLVTFQVGTRELGWARLTDGDSVVDGAWPNGVFLSRIDATGAPAAGSQRLVDLAGQTVAADLYGRIVAASDTYVVVVCGGLGPPCPGGAGSPTETRYAVHRLGG